MTWKRPDRLWPGGGSLHGGRCIPHWQSESGKPSNLDKFDGICSVQAVSSAGETQKRLLSDLIWRSFYKYDARSCEIVLVPLRLDGNLHTKSFQLWNEDQMIQLEILVSSQSDLCVYIWIRTLPHLASTNAPKIALRFGANPVWGWWHLSRKEEGKWGIQERCQGSLLGYLVFQQFVRKVSLEFIKRILVAVEKTTSACQQIWTII